MFRNLSFFKRITVEFTVSPSILVKLKGNNNTNFFLSLLFFVNTEYAFLLSFGSTIVDGTFKIIPSTTPSDKAGLRFCNSSELKPNIFDKL